MVDFAGCFNARLRIYVCGLIMKKDWQGKKVIILGAARQGLALTRYLSGFGAAVTLTDIRPADKLTKEIESLRNFQVEMVFGEHPLSLLDKAEIVCLSGGIPLTIPFVEEAKHRQIPLSNDSQIFLEACPARVVGITGSAGKTTTTALVGEMAKNYIAFKNNQQRAWIGGNIGFSLIEQVERIHEDDLVILELSSFQLELMTVSPQVAAVLNITPNHLDRHGNMEAYRHAKSQILIHQKSDDIAVLNREDPGAWDLLDQTQGELVTFGIKQPPTGINGTFVKRDHIAIQIEGSQIKLFPTDWIKLRGQHNLYNVLAACGIAAGTSIALPAIQSAVEEFNGVAHRLEFVRNWHGADWYNDSIATAPERSIAAIKSFSNPIILLVGGRDKNLPWENLIDLIRERVDHLIIFGEARSKVLETLGKLTTNRRPFTVSEHEKLSDAVLEAAKLAEEGDVVLLSPGGTSYDEFKDFEERGEMFRTWVKELL